MPNGSAFPTDPVVQSNSTPWSPEPECPNGTGNRAAGMQCRLKPDHRSNAWWFVSPLRVAMGAIPYLAGFGRWGVGEMMGPQSHTHDRAARPAVSEARGPSLPWEQRGKALSARAALPMMAEGTSHRQMSVLAFRPGRITRAIEAECLMDLQPCRVGGGFECRFTAVEGLNENQSSSARRAHSNSSGSSSSLKVVRSAWSFLDFLPLV